MKLLNYCLLLSLVASPILTMEPAKPEKNEEEQIIWPDQTSFLSYLPMELRKELMQYWLDPEERKLIYQKGKFYLPSQETLKLLIKNKGVQLCWRIEDPCEVGVLANFLQEEFEFRNNENAFEALKLFISEGAIEESKWLYVANLIYLINTRTYGQDNDDLKFTKFIELFKLLMTHVPLSKLLESDRQGIEQLYQNLKMRYPSRFN